MLQYVCCRLVTLHYTESIFFQDSLPPVYPICDDILQCCTHVGTDVGWEQATGDYEFKRKLSDVARDILAKAGSKEEALENLEKVAKDLVRLKTSTF